MSCKEEKPATVEKRGFTLKPAHLAWLGILSTVPGIAQNTAAVSSLRKRVEEAPAVSAFDRWKLKLKNPLIWHVDTPLEARIAAKLLGNKNKVTERAYRRALDRAVSEPIGALATAPKYPFGVIAYSRKTPEEVVKHEIGHIQDRVWESQKPSLSPLFVKKHPKYIDEVEAWDNANVPEDNPLREGALKTYEGGLRAQRDVTYVGVPALLASLIMKRPIKIAEDTGTALRKSAQARGIRQIQPIVSSVVDTLGGGEDAEKMMMGITGAETRYGWSPSTYKKRPFGRGLFQFDRQGFDATKDVASHPRLTKHYKKIKDKWGIDWNKVTYDDMYKPLHSAIGARLRLLNEPSAIPKTREGRAQYWKKHWNSYDPNAKGTPQKYLERTHPNYSMKANPAQPVAKMAENIAEKAAVIKQRSNKWALLSKDGKKVLGTHDTKDKAMKQEQAIQISKHASIGNADRAIEAPSLVAMAIKADDGSTKLAFEVELVDDLPARIKGMSKYAKAPAHGMLFDIPGPFWMKGVNYPLDVAFLSKEGTVVDVCHMPVTVAPDYLKARYASKSAEARYAIELPMQLSKTAQAQIGDKLVPLPPMSKEAISATAVRRAILGRQIRTELARLLGKHRYKLEGNALNRHAQGNARTKVVKQLLSALKNKREPQRHLSVNKQTATQLHRVYEQLMNRKVRDGAGIKERILYALNRNKNISGRKRLRDGSPEAEAAEQAMAGILGWLRSRPGRFRTALRAGRGNLSPVADGERVKSTTYTVGDYRTPEYRRTTTFAMPTGHNMELTTASGTPWRTNVDSLAHKDYPNLGVPLRKQHLDAYVDVDKELVPATEALVAELERLQTTDPKAYLKLKNDPSAQASIARKYISKPPGMRKMMPRLRNLRQALPATTVMTTQPGHPQVRSLYQTLGFAPLRDGDMVLPGHLPDKLWRLLQAQAIGRTASPETLKKIKTDPRRFDARQMLTRKGRDTMRSRAHKLQRLEAADSTRSDEADLLRELYDAAHVYDDDHAKLIRKARKLGGGKRQLSQHRKPQFTEADRLWFDEDMTGADSSLLDYVTTERGQKELAELLKRTREKAPQKREYAKIQRMARRLRRGTQNRGRTATS